MMKQKRNSNLTYGPCSVSGMTLIEAISKPIGLIDYCYPHKWSDDELSSVDLENMLPIATDGLEEVIIKQKQKNLYHMLRQFTKKEKEESDCQLKEIFDIIVKTADGILPVLTVEQYNAKYNLNPQLQNPF